MDIAKGRAYRGFPSNGRWLRSPERIVPEGNYREVDSRGDLQLPSWKAIFPDANGLFVIGAIFGVHRTAVHWAPTGLPRRLRSPLILVLINNLSDNLISVVLPIELVSKMIMTIFYLNGLTNSHISSRGNS